jgi:hypothetical protein
VAGWLSGCGFLVACLGSTGALVVAFQAEHSTDQLAYAGSWSVFALLGISIGWRYKPRQAVDRLTSCREMLKQRRSIRCAPYPQRAVADD